MNNTQVDDTKDLHVAMPIYNLTKCSYNYSETSGSWWKSCTDEPDGNTKVSISFEFKSRFTNNTGNAGTVDV